MIPTPAVFRVARLDMAARLPADLRTTEVPVFYATTRAPVDPGKPGHYRDAAGDGVMPGKAPVRLGPPGWQWDDLIASDVDLKTLASEYMPPVMDLARHTIVYMSRSDAALGFSRVIAGASRLGRPDIADLSVQDIERLAAGRRFQAVDVTDVRGAHEMGGMRGPGYWFANDWISTDVALSLRHSTPRAALPDPRAAPRRVDISGELCRLPGPASRRRLSRAAAQCAEGTVTGPGLAPAGPPSRSPV